MTRESICNKCKNFIRTRVRTKQKNVLYGEQTHVIYKEFNTTIINCPFVGYGYINIPNQDIIDCDKFKDIRKIKK